MLPRYKSAFVVLEYIPEGNPKEYIKLHKGYKAIHLQKPMVPMVQLLHLPLQTEVAGFGVQVPFGDIPSDVHTAVIVSVGTNPVLHLKSISVPPSVFGTATMEPFPGATGIPQLTGRRIDDKEK